MTDKKLKLQKEVVANLSQESLGIIKGGIIDILQGSQSLEDQSNRPQPKPQPQNTKKRNTKLDDCYSSAHLQNF